ncbi:UNVERIFIED_CONTAM: movement protein [Sesamum angustifolium]|uniref:Movement protein n=1 Tax=Sesamum angustifolium TaxID=2727405 RepID=A0AAW2LDL9_9LAMI
MDLQPGQNNYSEEDRLQTSESLSGFFSRMTVSNKTMKRIIRQDSNLSPYDGFRIGGIGKVLNQIGLNQRKHHIIYKDRIADQDFSRVLTLHQDFKRKDLMKEGNRPYSITYRIAYALSNTHHSDLFLRKEYIEIPIIFKEFAKVMTPDPIRIPRIGGVDIVIKDHPVLDKTMSSRTEFSSRMSFSKDRIVGYKGKEKDLSKVLTPHEIRVDNVKLRCPEGWKEIQPVVGRYEGMLEIAGHEILVTGVAGREKGSMIFGISFLEDHKPWGRKGNGMEFSLDGVTIRSNDKPLFYIHICGKGLFTENPNTQYGNTISQNHDRISQREMEGFEANSVMLRLRHLRENLEELDREFGRLAVNAQVAGQVQRADLDIVQTNTRSSLVASTALWNALQEPIRKASPSVMTRELREQGSKPALRVQDSKPVAADSSTACTRPSPDSGEKATIESQGVQTSDDSSQPSASGVKEEEISLRPMTGTSKVKQTDHRNIRKIQQSLDVRRVQT